MSVVSDKSRPGIAGLAGELGHVEPIVTGHPVGIGNELDAGVDPHIEPQILKLGAERRQAFGLFCLRAEFIQIEKFPQRLVARKPGALVENIRAVRSAGQLQIDTGIFAQQRIVNHLRQRVQIVGGLRLMITPRLSDRLPMAVRRLSSRSEFGACANSSKIQNDGDRPCARLSSADK